MQPRKRATGATLWGVPFRIERNSAGVAYEQLRQLRSCMGGEGPGPACRLPLEPLRPCGKSRGYWGGALGRHHGHTGATGEHGSTSHRFAIEELHGEELIGGYLPGSGPLRAFAAAPDGVFPFRLISSSLLLRRGWRGTCSGSVFGLLAQARGLRALAHCLTVA